MNIRIFLSFFNVLLLIWIFNLVNSAFGPLGKGALQMLLLLLWAVKRKDASSNKILTRRDRVDYHYHSLNYLVK